MVCRAVSMAGCEAPPASRAQVLLHVVTEQSWRHQDCPVPRTLPSVLGHLQGDKDPLGSLKAQLSHSQSESMAGEVTSLPSFSCEHQSKDWEGRADEMKGKRPAPLRLLQSQRAWLQPSGPVHREPRGGQPPP